MAYPVFAVAAAAAGAVAVPIQLEWPWITVAWALEALLLLWLSFALQIRELRWFGYLLFTASAAWLLGWDTLRALGEDFTLFLNWHMMNFGVTVVSFILAGYLLWRRRASLVRQERQSYVAFALAATAVPVQVDGIWIAVAWAAEAVLVLGLSERLAIREVRWIRYGLLAAMLIRLLALDTFDVDLETFRPALNWRFLVFAAGIGALYSAGWLAFRRPGDPANPIEETERRAAAGPDGAGQSGYPMAARG